jgi:hypothetical protein
MNINWKTLVPSTIIGLLFGFGFGYWIYDATKRLRNPSESLGIIIGLLFFLGATVLFYIVLEKLKMKKK